MDGTGKSPGHGGVRAGSTVAIKHLSYECSSASKTANKTNQVCLWYFVPRETLAGLDPAERLPSPYACPNPTVETHGCVTGVPPSSTWRPFVACTAGGPAVWTWSMTVMVDVDRPWQAASPTREGRPPRLGRRTPF